jgi:hypothetical protein
MSLNGFAQEKKGPLADLPSKPAAHIEKIKAMGDNEWLNLGVPAADPKWGKARGSSWGAKALILAPDKRGAFLYGEGVHGYVKPDGHVMDDLWFYDINKHAWLCLYPGTNTKTFTQRVKDKQLLIDEDGRNSLMVASCHNSLLRHTLRFATAPRLAANLYGRPKVPSTGPAKGVDRTPEHRSHRRRRLPTSWVNVPPRPSR